ncbi:MAG TPA: hypothetical protein VGA68_01390 [Woeseiaceae bacterium]
MTDNEHARHLGGLLANLQSLEFLLRGFLSQLPSARPFGLPNGTDIYSFPVGAQLPENDFTSYDSLDQLLEKFNSAMRADDKAEIGGSLIKLRDALAHGRISAEKENKTLRLIKFSRPKDGRVLVTFNELMTDAWFKEQNGQVINAIQYIHSQLKP